jgi:hypothetical protein
MLLDDTTHAAHNPTTHKPPYRFSRLIRVN